MHKQIRWILSTDVGFPNRIHLSSASAKTPPGKIGSTSGGSSGRRHPDSLGSKPRRPAAAAAACWWWSFRQCPVPGTKILVSRSGLHSGLGWLRSVLQNAKKGPKHEVMGSNLVTAKEATSLLVLQHNVTFVPLYHRIHFPPHSSDPSFLHWQQYDWSSSNQWAHPLITQVTVAYPKHWGLRCNDELRAELVRII